MTGTPRRTFYEEVGGPDVFERLAARFYELVETDPVLRPLYPDDDMEGAQERLRLFLVQYWGGPHDYSDQRGHPRLRLRHAPFAIGAAERDTWLRHMTTAVVSLQLTPEREHELLTYFRMAAARLGTLA